MNDNLNTFLSRNRFICYSLADVFIANFFLILTLISVFFNIYIHSPIKHNSPLVYSRSAPLTINKSVLCVTHLAPSFMISPIIASGEYIALNVLNK